MAQVFTDILIKKFAKAGEKTGWTYIEIPKVLSEKLKPKFKRSFKVRGTLDDSAIEMVALIPVGNGRFIMPLNAEMRRAIRKKEGDSLRVELEEDTSEFQFDADFIESLENDSAANDYFKSLPLSHRKYFSKWIASAKTDQTKVGRIVTAVSALARGLGYGEMIRAKKVFR